MKQNDEIKGTGFLTAKINNEAVELEIVTDIDTFNKLCDLLEMVANTEPAKFKNIDAMELHVDDENRLGMQFWDEENLNT